VLPKPNTAHLLETIIKNGYQSSRWDFECSVFNLAVNCQAIFGLSLWDRLALDCPAVTDYCLYCLISVPCGTIENSPVIHCRDSDVLFGSAAWLISLKMNGIVPKPHNEYRQEEGKLKETLVKW